MTERKPPGVSWETWIDRQIREGMERGDFDGLAGHGKPLADVDRPHDELWWVRNKLQREGVSYLPPTLALRKDVEDARDAITAAAERGRGARAWWRTSTSGSAPSTGRRPPAPRRT